MLLHVLGAGGDSVEYLKLVPKLHGECEDLDANILEVGRKNNLSYFWGMDHHSP